METSEAKTKIEANVIRRIQIEAHRNGYDYVLKVATHDDGSCLIHFGKHHSALPFCTRCLWETKFLSSGCENMEYDVVFEDNGLVSVKCIDIHAYGGFSTVVHTWDDQGVMLSARKT